MVVLFGSGAIMAIIISDMQLPCPDDLSRHDVRRKKSSNKHQDKDKSQEKKTQKLQHCTINRHLNNLEYIQWNKNDSQGDSEIFKAPADCPKVKPNQKF
jgi:hypothetical protein